MSKNHKKIILELVKDKQIDEQTIQDLKEEISHLRVQIKQQFENIRRRRERDNIKSIQSVETRRERERETTFIDSSIIVVSTSALSRFNYRSRDVNFAESLKENDSKEYNA
jgi:TolA-binding protein